MSTTLAATALLMGLAGGPHCVAMCGAACAGITRAGSARIDTSRLRGAGSGQLVAGEARTAGAMWSFQAGRLAGYAAAGGAAAAAVQSFAWLTTQTAALRPVWTLFHLAVLAWALMLVTQARQPMWVSAAGRSVWSRVRPLAAARGGVFVTGALWTLMPCGLLYSALLVASLSGGPLDGALAMALFALGSSVSLVLAPRLFDQLKVSGNRFGKDAGTRLAGLLLALAAAWGLWMDLAHRIAIWCGLA
jgi:sulfite exporter TauE/SafE